MKRPEVPHNRISSVAESQRGVIARAQMVASGMPDRTINSYIESGRVLRINPSTYRIAGAERSILQELQAAIVWGGEGTVASHRSAVKLYLPEFPWNGIEITIPNHTRRPRKDVIVHYATVDPIDYRVEAGIPVMSPARSLLTLGAVVHWSAEERVLDDMLILRIVTLDELCDVYDRVARRGMRGVSVFRRLLLPRIGTSIPYSRLELRMLKLIRDHNIAEPVCQHPVSVQGREYKIDFAYPEFMLAIEGDSARFHLGRQRLQSDLDRQNDLVQLGWTVLRFTWHDVVFRREIVAHRIRSALNRANLSR